MMKLFSNIAALSAAAATVGVAYAAEPYRGFNMGANRADGTCRTLEDWNTAFKTIKGWGNGFNSVRLYAAAGCNQLELASQAALSVKDFYIFVGLWSGGDAFTPDLTSLSFVIKNRGGDTSWIAAVSVGSEDLYRADVSPATIVDQISRTKEVLKDTKIRVTHVDTWTSWENENANKPVTDAVDFVTHNSFPYWEGHQPSTSTEAFFDAVKKTTDHAHGKTIWIGETGQPTDGEAFQGSGKPTVDALQTYWTNVGCALIKQNTNFWWYSAFDAPDAKEGVERHFGVSDQDGKLKIRLDC